MYHYHVPNRNGSQPKSNLIKVTGEGELSVPPDTASVNLGVITEAKELVSAGQQNAVEVSKVVSVLQSLGVPKNLIQTFDYRIETVYDYQDGKQLFRGYKITHLLQVKLEDLQAAGKLIDAAVQSGANYVSNVQFSLKNTETYYLQALSLALNNATNKAKAIASTLQVALVPTPIMIIESGSPIQPIHFPAESLAKGLSSTPVEPGQIQVRAIVSAEFHYHTNN
ncbi:SIMPL domain-containing protein [Bacillus sp. USDA818B3_A]|uniref:SIMPL domain-containing protein n=1 Tax=Bacillus sp. USDA818B3_A TaxID=2698834 RepID=UPI00136D7D33|nr:SIMPL domain-containing protein [Bacillus sp. USDA818B3_A]